MKKINSPFLSNHRRPKSSQTWINRHVKDHYVKLSSQNDLRSRSAYKLKEIQEKYKLITSPANYVIDMGAAPGGWSLIAADYLDYRGLLIAIDLLPISAVLPKNHQNIHLLQGDMFSTTISDQIDFIGKSHYKQLTIHQTTAIINPTSVSQPVNLFSQSDDQVIPTNDLMVMNDAYLSDVILSDMMVNMCGNKETDHFRSMDLCYNALQFTQQYLKPQGNFLCKYFRGKDDMELIQEGKKMFQTVKLVKPDASRQESNEMYLVCLHKRRNHD